MLSAFKLLSNLRGDFQHSEANVVFGLFGLQGANYYWHAAFDYSMIGEVVVLAAVMARIQCLFWES